MREEVTQERGGAWWFLKRRKGRKEEKKKDFYQTYFAYTYTCSLAYPLMYSSRAFS